MKRLLVLFFLIVAAAGALIIWLLVRDPLGSLPSPEQGLQVSSAASTLAEPHRRIEHMTLHSLSLGDIGFVMNLPDPLPEKKLPVLVVLGGLGTGENNIQYITEAGDNAIIGYDWPMPVRFYSGIGFMTQMPDLYGLLMTVPGQIASAVEWLADQPWADNQRVSILGFSLGALAAPAAQDLLEVGGQPVSSTIIAYGGAPFGALFAANPHIKPDWMRGALAPIIDLVLRPLEPTEHLPHLHGHFLVLEGHDDGLIPQAARDDIRNAVPGSKDVIIFDGTHMGVGPDKMVLLQHIIDASKKWLMDNGAVNQ